MSEGPIAFRPVRAVAQQVRAEGGKGIPRDVVAMTDREGRLLNIDMPDIEGAQLVAAAIQNEMKRSKRDAEAA